jgi:hypothetical protein
MEFEELSEPAKKLDSHADRIKLFGWWLHVHKNKPHFQSSDIRQCYERLHLAQPSSFGGYFTNLENRGDLLRSAVGYKLESRVRDAHEAKYGQRKTTIQVTHLLLSLPAQIPDLAERTYFDEALICYKTSAFRATVVMVWNLAYAHLCDYVLKNKLSDFNAGWLITFPGMHKSKPKFIVTIDDFRDKLKESEVLAICRDADIITKNVYNVLQPALVKRNAAAHPSGVMIDQLQTVAYISDLVTNAVLKIR